MRQNIEKTTATTTTMTGKSTNFLNETSEEAITANAREVSKIKVALN
jgi:hypothetical protein